MATEWYYANAGDRAGPVTEEQFLDLRQTGQIGPQTLVWRAGMAEWQPLSEAILAAVAAAANPGVCTVCARNVGAENLIAFQNSRVCADCKDGYFRQVREQGVDIALSGLRYAGFWIRFLARFIDSMIIGVVTWPLTIGFLALLGAGKIVGKPQNPPDTTQALAIFAWMSGIGFLAWLLQAVYEAWFLAKRGGTPGKLLVGIRVIRPDGGRLTFLRGFGRVFACHLSAWIFCIGYIMAAFDEEKRALHDRICDTRVIFKTS